jgi:chemotaxis protein MotB
MSRRRAGALAALAGAVLALAGCVTTATHEQVVGDLERRLAAERESAANERARWLAENDALREERDAARRRLAELERDLAPKARRYEELHPTYEGLVRDLEADLAAARIEIDRLREGLRTRLPAETLFASGSAELTPEGERVLAGLGARLAAAPYEVQVQGHTDDVPIRGALAARFPTNWELAAARAARVVRALEAAGVPPERLAAVSLGEHRPVVPEQTPEARAENRRIEIRLIPLPGARPAADAPVPEGFAMPPPTGGEPRPEAAGADSAAP